MLQNILLDLRIGCSILELGHIHIFQRELNPNLFRVDLSLGKQDHRLNGITFFPQEPPYLLTIPIYWEIKLYRLQRLLWLPIWIYLNFFYKISNKAFLFLVTYYIIELSEIQHKLVNIVQSDCFHFDRTFSQLCIFNPFFQLYNRIIQGIKS